MKHGFCPYYPNKEVKDNFNEIIVALGGKAMTDEEFRDVELRKQRTGRDLSAMNYAYKAWDLNKGQPMDLTPEGGKSTLFQDALAKTNSRRDAILTKIHSMNLFEQHPEYLYKENTKYTVSGAISDVIHMPYFSVIEMEDGKFKITFPIGYSGYFTKERTKSTVKPSITDALKQIGLRTVKHRFNNGRIDIQYQNNNKYFIVEPIPKKTTEPKKQQPKKKRALDSLTWDEFRFSAEYYRYDYHLKEQEENDFNNRNVVSSERDENGNVPLIERIVADEETRRGELGVNKEQLIALLGSTMYKQSVQTTAVKELVQNAFDAVKIANAEGKVSNPTIDVILDSGERTVTVSDNGTGMTPEIVQKAFFTIGGSYKGDNVDNRLKSGGLGLAKMAFLFSSEYVEVTTVKDGVKTYVKATPDQIKSDAGFDIVTSKTTEPSGTTVTVKIPKSYIDENGETRDIYFDSSPSFLSKPMIGNVTVNVTEKGGYWGDTKKSEDKNKIPEGYVSIGTATTDFGDIELYVRKAKYGRISCQVLISGLYQFTHTVYNQSGAPLEVIANILPTVGVKSPTYPINNQREGFRGVVQPEVKDLDFLLERISNLLERKSITAAFGNSVSMDVSAVNNVKREVSDDELLKTVIKDVKRQFKPTDTQNTNNKEEENTIDFGAVRSKREESEKQRNSSFNASGIKLEDEQQAVDTSSFDITKPLFHNNTTMTIDEDGKKFLNELGVLLMELKELYMQTYRNDTELETRFNHLPIVEYLSKQFWGFSFDKSYGGVNVHPTVMPFLSINPFYILPKAKNANFVTSLVGIIEHLIIHEFNHNYESGEGSGFTGRFPSTQGEFYGIGVSYTKEWRNKLYILVKNNIETITKYHDRYEQSTNRGESFKGSNITTGNTQRDTGVGSNVENIQEYRSGEDVQGYGEDIRGLYQEAQRVASKNKRKPYVTPETVRVALTAEEDLMSQENPTASSPRTTSGYVRGSTTETVAEHNASLLKKLQNKLESLYKQYTRSDKKTLARQKTQNAIFETFNRIKHIEAQQAIQHVLDLIAEKVGLVDDSGEVQNPNSIIYYLKRQATSGFQNVNSETLMDMYKNLLLPMRSLLDDITLDDIFTECNGITEQDRINAAKLYKACSEALNEFARLWTEAMVVCSDKIVDSIIDDQVFLPSEEATEGMREVVKDFLHKGISTGDLAWFDTLANYGYSRNPIIKQMFHLITSSDAKTRRELIGHQHKILKAYRNADSFFKRADWQSLMLERDRDGNFTGNFIREINYGQYEQDLNNFVKQLNKQFDNTYGHHYIYDGTNVLVNSTTLQDASDEEWINGTPPPVVEYWKALYTWKCSRANLRYTKDYYMQRLSEPYNSEIDPRLNTGKAQKHGLSPKTMILYEGIQSRINYYLDQCIGDDGFSHPENLDDTSKRNLDDALEELKELSNPFEPNGVDYKPEEQRKIAFEILSWQKFINEQTYSVADLQKFTDLANKVYNKAVAANNKKLWEDFIKYNARYSVNPHYITFVFGNFKDTPTINAELYKAQLQKSALQALVRTKDGDPILTRDLQQFVNDIEFWKKCKENDEIIEHLREKRDKAFVDRLNYYFKFNPIPYRDASGQMIDKHTGQPTTDEDKAIKYVDYIIDVYTQRAIRDGYIDGITDGNGNLIPFRGTDDEIRQQVMMLFTYERSYYDADADEWVSEQTPLSIFTMMVPKFDEFDNPDTGLHENTVLYYPTRQFVQKRNKMSTNQNDKSYINSDFDINANIAEQPKEQHYDNSKNYDIMRKKCGDLYDTLIEAMTEANAMYNNRSKFNYKAPQINVTNMQMLSRLIEIGAGDLAKIFMDSIREIQANDQYAVREDELLHDSEGRLIKALPHRFTRPIKDPRTLSSSLAETVILFMEAAIDFKNKSAIRADLELLREALASRETRTRRNDKTVKMADNMMNRHFYHNLLGNREDQSTSSVVAEKAYRTIQELLTKQMLGLNLMSAAVGFGDAQLSMIQDSFGMKYMTPKEGIHSMIYILSKIPQIIKNIGNPIPNTKIGALMQIFGTNTSTRSTLKYLNRNKIRRIFKEFLMSPFQAGDYITRCMMLHQYLHDIQFYPGDGKNIKPGFYSRFQLKNIMYKNGYTYKDFIATRMMKTVNLWNMFDFNDGIVEITSKDKYKNYVPYVKESLLNLMHSKTQQRAGLVNGMNPDNDTPEWKSSAIGLFVGAMRGFITQRLQHIFVDPNETVLLEPEENITEETQFGKTKLFKRKPKYRKLTGQERQRVASWNYETGTTNDGALIDLWRAGGTFRRKFFLFFAGNKQGWKEDVKYSQQERQALLNAGIVLAMICLMMTLWPILHNWAARVAVPPKDRDEAGMKDLQYLKSRFIDDNLWALAADVLAFRLIESQLTTIDPRTLYGLLGQVTTLSSGLENTLKAPKTLIWDDMIQHKHNYSDVIKDYGAYKYYTYGERGWYYLFGPLRNLHTATAYYGLFFNLKFYVDTYGYLYDLAGYDYKQAYPKKKKVSEMNTRELIEHKRELQRKKLDDLRNGRRNR